MKPELVAPVLAPLLIMQGRHVRRVTPRLPEAKGPREGTSGTGRPLRLLIAGDSSAAGVGVETQAEALSGQLVSPLAEHAAVSWRLVAKTGHRIRDVIADLEALPPETCDVAVVAVGVNDATGGTSSKAWREGLGTLCGCLETRFAVRHIFLSPVPPMQAFPALPQPLRWYLGRVAASLNHATLDFMAGSESRHCVDPRFPLTRDFMAADGFHPGARAYVLWARALASAIREKVY